MDPLSAFSLVAGILQVVDVSFRAVSTCREIYKDGSLAEHRDSRDITEKLSETLQHLEQTYSNLPASTKYVISAVNFSRGIVPHWKFFLSNSTGRLLTLSHRKLLTELNKLQQDPKGGFRESIRKGFSTWRKKQFLAQLQGRLDRYREILNTRILSKLDSHALQQIESYNKLDQSIKDLAVGLSEGRNTYEQLLATHTTVIQEHIDRRFDAKAHEEAMLRAQQQFKDSLFYPEIFARQDDVARSHEGTCRWIFGPPKADDDIQSDSPSSTVRFQAQATEHSRDQPWSNFKDWLEGNSKDPYWLSGKPGSGKSTLMKYISSEFCTYCRSQETISAWGDAVICSFFFWNLGSSLQRNYVGLLRSLLFQIAKQRPEMIQFMGDQYNPPGSSPTEFEGPNLIYTWTEQRLDEALRRFLKCKPPSTRVCMFIDGLDEFDGDEDRLIETIHTLSHASGTKICASSRPEQIFRQGFTTSPQLKLQDLNYRDIRKAASERLLPVLKAHVRCAQDEIDALVRNLIKKSQGIFLWAELMTRDLKRGAKNADSIEELQDRLERTPDTIDGLYEHMLSRLDKAYLRDATRYFHYLLAFQDSVFYNIPTLLGFACSEGDITSRQVRENSALITSQTIHDLCHRVETRILTRCAGLVEIEDRVIFHSPFCQLVCDKEHGLDWNEGDKTIRRHLRRVKFIHKSATDFVRNHGEFFEDPDWKTTAISSVIRSQIRVAELAPMMISKRTTAAEEPIYLDQEFLRSLITLSRPKDGYSETLRDTAVRIVDELVDILYYLNITFNGPSCTVSKTYGWVGATLGIRVMDDSHPFQTRLGFAAYFGHHEYIARHVACNNISQDEIECIVNCTLLGFDRLFYYTAHEQMRVDYFNILLEYIPQSRDPNFTTSSGDENDAGDHPSKWSAFVTSSLGAMEPIFAQGKYLPSSQMVKSWIEVMKAFLNHTADIDVNVAPTGSMCFLDSRPRIDLMYDETVMSWIERIKLTITPLYIDEIHDELNEIEDVLRARGGMRIRNFHSIGKHSLEERFRLTDDQSNRLARALTPEHLTEGTPRSLSPLDDHVQADPKRTEELVVLVEAWGQ
ncbi:MAG: hypothetical protein Q9216_003398 [Gyalolechia sp. 2 TL-2023]